MLHTIKWIFFTEVCCKWDGSHVSFPFQYFSLFAAHTRFLCDRVLIHQGRSGQAPSRSAVLGLASDSRQYMSCLGQELPFVFPLCQEREKRDKTLLYLSKLAGRL